MVNLVYKFCSLFESFYRVIFTLLSGYSYKQNFKSSCFYLFFLLILFTLCFMVPLISESVHPTFVILPPVGFDHWESSCCFFLFQALGTIHTEYDVNYATVVVEQRLLVDPHRKQFQHFCNFLWPSPSCI